jgi:hypothetical protein
MVVKWFKIMQFCWKMEVMAKNVHFVAPERSLFKKLFQIENKINLETELA